jgi:hypothetical protein
MATDFTLTDAKKFLNETLKFWQENGQSQKVIKLAKWAEKWTVSTDRSDKDKMKILYTSANQTKAQIKRDASLGIPTEEGTQKLKTYQTALTELEAKYGKYIPSKPKKKVKKTDVIE